MLISGAVGMSVAWYSTGDTAVGVLALLSLCLVALVSRPWVFIYRSRIWRSPTFGKPLQVGDVASVRANGARLEASVGGRWRLVATLPYAGWGPVDGVGEAERLRELIDGA